MRIYNLGLCFIFSAFSTGIYFVFLRNRNMLRRKAGVQKLLHNLKETVKRTVTAKFLTERSNVVLEKEIYQGVAFLQNYAILQRYAPKGAVFTIEQLIAYMDKLKAPLEMLLHYLRINRGKEGITAFANQVKSKYAEGFARILVSLDEMSLTDVQETLEMYRQNMREENITKEKQKNEIMSDLVYIPVMCNVMLIFINFIYIAYYAQQKELFQQLLF